jgi:DNA-binding CsgD family transcriptional regulator
MMAEGLSQKEIADRLYLSPNTVNTHTQHIYEKMEVHTGPHAVAKAIRARIIE